MELPKIINKAELARKMGIEPQNLNNKLKGSNRQWFTEFDLSKAVEAMSEAIQKMGSNCVTLTLEESDILIESLHNLYREMEDNPRRSAVNDLYKKIRSTN